ncbi:hypothetical protein LMG31884_47600 (plasmid) [Xanthomonas hydrangeae]|uniref:type IV secretion system protein VirB3 n=1 Tax=Xanthomonas hydrangeae TaxID=2775159 RepID=UPI001964562D|nr:hypothetical protein LMG31884_47600 [Xanthomonas hydrangeae]CAD7741359.1 hypothetical protein LMG31884_47600 [Xanthomonas hydrangeae]CAD7747904.1 hypothetical protein LMG31887_46230 [Xanthomonas hydrangeae]CAD7747905.1 hypothetical protein LMG31887_46230 [Xanthomonas hydrangeae]CAD7748218.1 hypothetical protein LMG31885_45260 [Xanthomonas hydrangeae]
MSNYPPEGSSEAKAGPRPDPLFAALTRPSTLFGVTAEVFGFIVMVEMAAFMLTRNVVVLISGVLLYGVARVISAKDARIFKYLHLAVLTKWKGQNRSIWKASSYSTLPSKKRK